MPVDAYERPIQYLPRIGHRPVQPPVCLLYARRGVPKLPHEEILRNEEIVRIVRIAVELGFVHIRLTGGSHWCGGLWALVADLARLPGLDDLSMTTNGILLREYAAPLARAGLRRVNISLDTLRPERFRQMTRLGDLEDVLAGREAALAAGLRPVKINMVVVRGLNDDEVVDMARLTLEPEWHVRFIEVMPLGAGAHWMGDGVVPSSEMRSRIEAALGPLTPVYGEIGIGPARYYQLPGARGTIGFISAVTEHFCQYCNRLRLTSDGQLLPCLLSSATIDLRTPLRNGATDEELRALFLQAVVAKPRGHTLSEASRPSALPMSHIGG